MATVLLSLVYGVASLSVSGERANQYSARLNRAVDANRMALDRIRVDLESAVELFGDDARGVGLEAYLLREDLPDVLPGSRMPRPQQSQTFQEDAAGDEITGNELFMARLAWSTEVATSLGTRHRVDVHRFVHYFLHDDHGKGDPALGFELIRWVGEPMADAQQVAAIEDPDAREEVLLHLATSTPAADGSTYPAVTVLWDRTADPVAGDPFDQILDDGTVEDDPDPDTGRPSPDWMILPGVPAPALGQLATRNFAVIHNEGPESLHVGRHGLADPTDGGFPHGFEIQVTGPSSARTVLVRLAIASRIQRDRAAGSNLKAVVAVRET